MLHLKAGTGQTLYTHFKAEAPKTHTAELRVRIPRGVTSVNRSSKAYMAHPTRGCNPPPPKSAKKSQQIGGTNRRTDFQQNSFPVPWISVPGPKHTFLLVAL